MEVPSSRSSSTYKLLREEGENEEAIEDEENSFAIPILQWVYYYLVRIVLHYTVCFFGFTQFQFVILEKKLEVRFIKLKTLPL